MLKNKHSSAVQPAKQTKHEQEMSILRAHHERVLKDNTLRQATLIGAGLFERASDGKLVVAKPYDKIIVPKRPT